VLGQQQNRGQEWRRALGNGNGNKKRRGYQWRHGKAQGCRRSASSGRALHVLRAQRLRHDLDADWRAGTRTAADTCHTGRFGERRRRAWRRCAVKCAVVAVVVVEDRCLGRETRQARNKP
jgi:hypothetical protein